MSHARPTRPPCPRPPSPLVLADGLIRLAADADRAGQTRTALRLIELAYGVLDPAPDAAAAA